MLTPLLLLLALNPITVDCHGDTAQVSFTVEPGSAAVSVTDTGFSNEADTPGGTWTFAVPVTGEHTVRVLSGGVWSELTFTCDGSGQDLPTNRSAWREPHVDVYHPTNRFGEFVAF